MDLTTLQTRLRERIGNPDTTDVPDATLTLRINEAYGDILDNYNFHASKATSTSITTVAGTQNYTPVAGTDVVIGVRDATNGLRLKKRDRVWFDELPASQTNGKPENYFWDGTTLWITGPPPDGAYSIRVRYRKAVTALSAGGDLPVIPVSWHNGIVLLARVKHREVTEDWSKYSTAMQAWNDWINKKTDEVAEESKADYDQAVRLPDLERFSSTSRYDFDHED